MFRLLGFGLGFGAWGLGFWDSALGLGGFGIWLRVLEFCVEFWV